MSNLVNADKKKTLIQVICDDVLNNHLDAEHVLPVLIGATDRVGAALDSFSTISTLKKDLCPSILGVCR